MYIDETLVSRYYQCCDIANQQQRRRDSIIFPSCYHIHRSETVNKCVTNSAILSINNIMLSIRTT